MLVFRKSTHADTEQMARIADEGKALLRERGISQWQRGTYPDKALFDADVDNGIGYVVADGDEVVAVCAVTFTDEESYRVLNTGAWLTPNDQVYATVHRGAVARAHQGKKITTVLFDGCADLAREHGVKSLRGDTHPDNIAMQKSLERAGFVKCGTLTLIGGDEDGDERLAYERLL